jgi:hypothetical protein
MLHHRIQWHRTILRSHRWHLLRGYILHARRTMLWRWMLPSCKSILFKVIIDSTNHIKGYRLSSLPRWLLQEQVGLFLGILHPMRLLIFLSSTCNVPATCLSYTDSLCANVSDDAIRAMECCPSSLPFCKTLPGSGAGCYAVLPTTSISPG